MISDDEISLKRGKKYAEKEIRDYENNNNNLMKQINNLKASKNLAHKNKRMHGVTSIKLKKG